VRDHGSSGGTYQLKGPRGVTAYTGGQGMADQSVIRTLAEMGIYYNGAGRFRAATATAADAGISWLRSKGVHAARQERPKAERMTMAHAIAIGGSISAPKRWTI